MSRIDANAESDTSAETLRPLTGLAIVALIAFISIIIGFHLTDVIAANQQCTGDAQVYSTLDLLYATEHDRNDWGRELELMAFAKDDCRQIIQSWGPLGFEINHDAHVWVNTPEPVNMGGMA